MLTPSVAAATMRMSLVVARGNQIRWSFNKAKRMLLFPLVLFVIHAAHFPFSKINHFPP